MPKKYPLGCEPAVGSLDPSNKREYKITQTVKEEKRPIYGIAFNFLDSSYFNVFATVGGNMIRVYQCLEGGRISLLQKYVDEDNVLGTYPDAQKEETFYTVSWACNVDGGPLLVAAGLKGVIRVIDVATGKKCKSFVGHGKAINEIRTQALKPSLVLSASKDESVRLWNVHTGVCVLIFAGERGHRNEVISVDFHSSNMHLIASCGMDNTVKIWSIKDFWPHVEKSFTWTDRPSKFPTKRVQFPELVACVHENYVDCNRWLGNFILSKSTENELVLWEPIMTGEGQTDTLVIYPVPECDLWFMKFSFDFHCQVACIGNKKGTMYVWELHTCPPVLLAKLSNKKSKALIRQTAISFDGSIILGCSEDGKIWRWDENSTSK